MTVYLVFEALEKGQLTWESKVVTSERAFAEPPSKIGLPVGGELPLHQAVRALLIKSANDVAVMLAETVAGNKEAFVERMNATARRLGMSRTHFANPNGLPEPSQVTTARDMGLLGRAVVRDFPVHAPMFAEQEMWIGNIHLVSYNGLLKSFPGADGLKTGFICGSGFNIVASATRNGRRLIAVVFGEYSVEGRTVRSASLLEHGFEHLAWKAAFNAASIDKLPLDPPGPVAVRDLREIDRTWECGAPIAARTPKLKVARKKPDAAAPDGQATAATSPAAAKPAVKKAAAKAPAAVPAAAQ
jgi:D-alanyl-D-alanine carboxypeptidase